MGACRRRNSIIGCPCWGLLLLLSLLFFARGSSVERNLGQALDATWAGQTTIIGLYPTFISNDGNANLQAKLQGPGCPAATVRLSLAFIGASPSGDDLLLGGVMSADCRSAAFRGLTSQDFKGMRAGAYAVRVYAGETQLLMAVAADDGSNGSGESNNTQTSQTLLVMVTAAAVGRFLDQSPTVSSSSLTVTLRAGMDVPITLPTALALRLSDPAAAEVLPPVVTWRPGEVGSKEFKLRLRRAAGPGQAALWAEAVPVNNLVFDTDTPPRVEIVVPRPAFYVVANQAVYRRPSGGGGSNASSSSMQGGGMQALESIAITIRRATPSPFPSTLIYNATVLQAMGCPGQACASAVYGGGPVSFSPDADAALASVLINWTALPREAILRVGLLLTPGANADIVAIPDTLTALYVYGTVYGTCPAGTSGPWHLPAPATVAPQDPATSSSPAAGNWSLAPSPASPPVPPKTCNDSALRRPLLSHSPSAALLPVLIACADGAAALVAATAVDGTGVSPSPGASGAPASSPASSLAPGPSTPAARVELQVPFDQDIAAVFLPLQSAAETVVVINTTCSPPPIWAGALTPVPSGSGGAPAGGSGGTGSKSQPGAATAWMRWDLTSPAQPCYVLVGVYDTVPTSTNPQQQQQGSKAPGNVDGGTRLARSPTPSAGPAAQPATNGGPAPASLTPGGSGPSPSSPAGPSGASNDGGASMPIFSMTLLRTYNVILRPRSDPETFSGQSLSLSLVHRPSGLCLPLCGLPQQLLFAAGVQAFGVAFDASSPTQLAWAAATMAQAIRGSPEAMMVLQPIVSAPSAGSSGGASAGGRKLLQMSVALRRWLAGRLPGGWGKASLRDGGAGGIAAAAVHLGAGGHGRLGGSDGSNRKQTAALGDHRRILQGGDGPAQAPVPAPALRPPSPAPSRQPPSPASEIPPPPAPLEPPTASRRFNPGPPPLPAPMPLPSPGRGSGPLVASGPGAGLQGPVSVAATAPDGFDMPNGNGGTAHVLFNQQFVEWCSSSDAQMVDLALLPTAYDMTLQASSGGMVLQQADGEEVVVGPTIREELLQQQREAPAAPADEPGATGQLPGSSGSTSTKAMLESRGPGISPALSSSNGGRDAPQVSPSGGPSPGATRTPGPATMSSPGGISSNAGDIVYCPANASQLTADKRLALALLAPDGFSTAAFQLHLYVDFAAAAAMAVSAAAKCKGNNSSSGNVGDGGGRGGRGQRMVGGGNAGVSSSPGPKAAPATMTAQVSLLSWPAPLSPLDACQPCGGGTFSSVANASVCQQCSPGSFSPDTYNKECTPCAAGTFTTQAGSGTCRPCYAGSFTPRAGSTNCSVCPVGTTTMADGARQCIADPTPTQSDVSMLVSFQVLLSVSQQGGSAAQATTATGIDAPTGSIFMLLIAADTAEALRIPPSQVRVSLMEFGPSAFLVNVSATMPMGQASGAGAGGGTDTGAPGGSGTSPSKEVDADTLINRLVDNPDSFPRTKEATGGSLQVQYVQRQVVTLDDTPGGINVNVVVWPTLGGTLILAAVVGLACSRYYRRRRARQGVSLPPLSDALGRLCPWKSPSSPPPVYMTFGQITSLELQDGPSTSAVARHRPRGASKPLGQDGLSGSGSVTELDILAMMYTRDALAATRI